MHQYLENCALTLKGALANQSLKLTEVAVDDFARAKQPTTIGRDLARADWLRLAAARRRSLAPVR